MTDHNPGNPGELPALEQPPGVIEGAGGGPAFPTGGGLSASEKQEISDASDTIEVISYGTAVGAGLAGMGGVAPAAAGLGVFAAALYCISQILDMIVADPPKPFARVVVFDRRISRPPAMSDPILERVGVGSQYAVAAVVTGEGYLDALERLGGAQADQNVDWAITHAGVALQCHHALAVDLATLAAALNSAGTSLKASAYDSPLTLGAGGIQTWIESPRVEPEMVGHLKNAGLKTTEIRQVIQAWKADPTYSGSAATLSAEFTTSAQTLYTIAERIYDRY